MKAAQNCILPWVIPFNYVTMENRTFNRSINLAILILAAAAIYIGYSIFHQDGDEIRRYETPPTLLEKKETPGEKPVVMPAPETRSNTIKDDASTDLFNEEGLRFYNQGRYEEAADSFRRAHEKDKNNDALKMNLAYTESRLGWREIEAGRYGESLRYFREAMELNDKVPDSYFGMGFALHQLKDDDRAIESINRGLAIDPKRTEGYKLLAEIHYHKDNAELAISNLEAALKLAPNDNNLKGMLSKINREKKAEGGFQQEATEHFTVRFEGREERDIARIITIILEEAYREVGASFSFYPGDPTTVILYSEEKFRDVTLTPAWTKGIFDGKIRLPIGGALNDKDLLEKVIFHEYTHAVVHNISGKDVPRWLNEGLAVYMEHGDKKRLEDRIISEIKKGGRIIPLHELHDSFMDSEESRVPILYAESYSAVDYLIDRYGIFRVKTLLEELSRGREFKDAFRDLFFISYDEFQSAWEKSIMNRV